MALLPIVTHPDPVLRRPCVPVGAVTDRVRALAADMLETMYAAPGRGLAAPQVGLGLRMFVMDVGWKEGAPDPVVCIDPVILAVSDAMVTGPEGCLSIPGVPCRVTRPAAITLEWSDLLGQRQCADLTGFAAICAQHEWDHLNGRLCIDLDEGLQSGGAA
jgi:peptide deformylase